MTETTKVMYIVVVDGDVDITTVILEEDGSGNWKDSFRYTRPVLQSTLQLMGCKARHAFKISRRAFELIRSEGSLILSPSHGKESVFGKAVDAPSACDGVEKVNKVNFSATNDADDKSRNAMTASKIPAFLYVGLCKDDIFIAQDLKAEFASLHPWKETLKDRAFKSSLDSSVELFFQAVALSSMLKLSTTVVVIFDDDQLKKKLPLLQIHSRYHESSDVFKPHNGFVISSTIKLICLIHLLLDFDSRLNAHEWNQKAKEEINLQKDVQVSVQALEHVRNFDSKKLGSQLKTIDEGDGYSEWQWDRHIPFIRRLKKIMKELQAWLKVELREVRRDKRRQRDAEDEQACSKHQERSAQSKGYGLGPNRWSFVRSSVDTKKERLRQRSLSVAKAKSLGGRGLKHPGSASMASLGEIEESNDFVNHIGGVFRYFIVDVVDHGSTPDVARCGRELGEVMNKD
ncbi:hypothetical protein F2Q69_00044299 [Brassica cretica]|uniref:Uncharacterized protein n=1 Tax=Brassica cretica TaxID=69181 RepID=A0A8S9NQG6_BRACR|nr:hypothetical protein F2Q69_00044299 [Brassica cretica]